jgi:hypothetical protein
VSRGDESRLTLPAELPVGNPAALTPLDLATANMLGHEPRERLPRKRRASLRQVLYDVIEPALASGRCLVSFSGGRESAVLLASATAAARARGYPDPIPATLRYPLASASREVRQQERAVSHLGLSDWVRVEIEDELELVGPYARRALAAAGVLFPVTSYALLPLLDRARGGWLLAGGAFGDFFAYWRWGRLADVVAGRRRPRRRDLRQFALAALPRPAREHLVRARFNYKPLPWLRKDAAREVEQLVAEETAAVPVRFHSALARQRLLRCYGGMRASLDALANSSGARLLMPFRTEVCIAAAAAEGGRLGFGDRNQSAVRLAGELLPDELLTRSNVVAEQRSSSAHGRGSSPHAGPEAASTLPSSTRRRCTGPGREGSCRGPRRCSSNSPSSTTADWPKIQVGEK